jgi:hypothetical protein
MQVLAAPAVGYMKFFVHAFSLLFRPRGDKQRRLPLRKPH